MRIATITQAWLDHLTHALFGQPQMRYDVKRATEDRRRLPVLTTYPRRKGR